MDHELQKFLAIVEAGSFTGAAETLHVSQPALTLAMKNLERRIGHQLLIRGGKITLTEAGKAVYDSARYMRLELDNLNHRLSDKEGGIQERLRLGMIDSIGDLLLSQHPDIHAQQLDITVDDSQSLVNAVLLDRIDVGFVSRQLRIGSDELKFIRIGKEPFILVVQPALVEETKKDIRKKLLKNMLAYNEKSNTFGLMSRSLRGHGVRMQPSTFSTDPSLLKTLALGGRGPAMLPLRMVNFEIENGELAALPFEFEREIQMVYRTGRYLSKELLNIKEAIQSHLNEEIELTKEYLR